MFLKQSFLFFQLLQISIITIVVYNCIILHLLFLIYLIFIIRVYAIYLFILFFAFLNFFPFIFNIDKHSVNYIFSLRTMIFLFLLILRCLQIFICLKFIVRVINHDYVRLLFILLIYNTLSSHSSFCCMTTFILFKFVQQYIFFNFSYNNI